MERHSLSNNSMKEYHSSTRSSLDTIRSSDSNNKMVMIKNFNHKFSDHSSSSSWKVNNYEEAEEDYMNVNGFSWPPRSYTCSFCKREFRSAQALGGHMNVHRKDRARLRQYSPPRDHNGYGTTTTTTTTSTIFNLNLNPNPNPNFSSSYSSVATRLPPLIPYSPLSSNLASPSLSSLSYSPYCVANSPNYENKKCPWSSTTSLEYHTEVMLDHDLTMSTEGSDLAKMIKSKQSVYGVGDNECFAEEDLFKNLNKPEMANSVRLDLEIGSLGDSKICSRDLDLELRLGYS